MAVGNFFALDIGSTAVRVVQLAHAGNGWSLARYGYAPVSVQIANSDSPEDRRKLGDIIATAVGQSGIHTRDVVIGLPSNKTFISVVDVPKMSDSELRSTLKYQVEQYIPTSIDESKVDYAVLGQSLHDQTKLEILLASVPNNYNESRLELIESLGFNVIAAEPDSIAMTRALLPDAVADARLLIDVGDLATDIVVTYADAPRLVRTIPFGMTSLVKAASSNLNVADTQAYQFIMKFGLAPDRLEGQVVKAVASTLETFVGELTKSAKFFETRYGTVPLTQALLSGYGASIPMFDAYLSKATAVSVVAGNPWQKVHVGSADGQKLAPIANQFAVAIGLAQKRNVE
jgi:type IV pilus assembly protein PilM